MARVGSVDFKNCFTIKVAKSKWALADNSTIYTVQLCSTLTERKATQVLALSELRTLVCYSLRASRRAALRSNHLT